MKIHLVSPATIQADLLDTLGVVNLHNGFAQVDDIIVTSHAIGAVDIRRVVASGRLMGLDTAYTTYRLEPLCTFNTNGAEPIPGGPMRVAWEKGKAAFSDKVALADYPGDKGTAPHKVWIKGWLWAYVASHV